MQHPSGITNPGKLAADPVSNFMKAFTTTDASLFLQNIQSALEQDEAVNQPVLVRCRRLAENGSVTDPALMAWTEDAQGVTSAAFFAPPDPMWLFCEPLPKEPSLRLLLNMLRDVPFKRVKGKTHVIDTFSLLTRQLFNCSITRIARQYVWRITSAPNPPFVAGYMRKAALPDADQLMDWMESSRLEKPISGSHQVHRQEVLAGIARGEYFVWEDGLIVAMGGRTLITRHGVALGELFTPPMLRNRGYATALMGSLCQQAKLDGFIFCSVTSDPANSIANHVFQKLGFTIISEIDEIEVNS